MFSDNPHTAKVGNLLVKVALDIPASGVQECPGFMVGQISIPDDFDRMGDAAIADLFEAA